MARVVERNRLAYRVEDLIVSPNANPFADIWYVDGTNGVDTNTGKDPGDAFKTLDKARSSSAAGDVIVIAPGTYTQTAAEEPLTPKARQVYMAAVPNGMGKPTVIITGTAEAVVVDVDVSGVVFIGIEFQADADAVAQLVRVANSAAVSGLMFLNCWFNGNGKATVNGISSVHATLAVTGMYVRECRFADLDNGIIIGVSGMPQSCIEYNIFECKDNGGADNGIDLADTTAAATGYGYMIRFNDFIGPPDAGADAVGIVIAGTEDTTGMGGIRNNFFSYMTAAAITIDKLSKSEINNYYGDAATGGTLVDPGT